MPSNNRKVTMFAGKGGVGKTTCATATAVHHALQGEETLVLSTDPTPSLSHIFGMDGHQQPKKVADHLYLAEIGADQMKEMWDAKFGKEVYVVFSSFVAISYEEFVDFIISILPGLGEEFMVDYIKELVHSGKYQHVVWDTAPLGQTLGLLETPGLLNKHLKPAPRIYSRLMSSASAKKSVLEILEGWDKLSREDMHFLGNDVSFVLVTIPEALAVEQIDGIITKFNKLQIGFDRLIINNVIKETSSPFLQAKADQQQKYVRLLHQKYGPLIQIVELPMCSHEIKGVSLLAELSSQLFA